MDTYSLQVKDALQFAEFLDGLRRQGGFTECIGENDKEKNYQRNYRFPFREYGGVKEACLLVNGNTFALMLLYDRYRISYSLQAQLQWKDVILESFGGDYRNCSYDHYNVLSGSHIEEIIKLFKGKFKAGSNNLYGILGHMSNNVNFLQNYIQDIVTNI